LLASLAVVVVLCGIGLLAYGVPVATDYAYVCENTGSRYGYRVWWTGARANDWYKPSPLEDFMRAEYPGVVRHRWTSYAGTGKNVVGESISFGHGAPGPAYRLTRLDMATWISRHSRDEVRALYDTLASGNRAAAGSMIDQIEREVDDYR
jgi:hypothetical protein